MKFRPEIEGLRAVAIATVIAYHANSDFVTGGFVGVDVFFVVSGFLISKSIIGDIERGTFSIVQFYHKRIRRIFPALFSMLATTALVAPFVLSPTRLDEFAKTLLSTAFFASNMELLRLTTYFENAAELNPLLHTWTLAVEEQFYILFPFFLIAVNRWFGNRLFAVALIGTLLCFAGSAWMVIYHPYAAFYLGPARAFELMIGALLAIEPLPQVRSRFLREALSIAGLALIFVSAWIFDKGSSFPGWQALVPCAGASIVIFATPSGPSIAKSLLSLSPIRFIGSISYSLYLWHWPILSFARNYNLGDLNRLQTVEALLAAFIVALLSWRYVELPFRFAHEYRRDLFIPAAICTASVVAVGAIAVAGEGFPNRFPKESQRLFAYKEDYNHRRPECHGERANIIEYSNNCYYGNPKSHEVVAVWGDSHGAELSAELGEALGSELGVLQITSSSCPPALDFRATLGCAEHNLDTFVHLTQDRRIKTVLLVGYYSFYSRQWGEALRDGLEKTVSGLVSSAKQVILIDPFPHFGFPVPEALGMEVARGLSADTYGIERAQYERENAATISELDRLAVQFSLPHVTTEDIFCASEHCSAFDGRDALFFDDNHLSMSGARKVASAIVTSSSFSPDVLSK